MLEADSTTQDALSPRPTTTLNNIENPIDFEKSNTSSKKQLRFEGPASSNDSESNHLWKTAESDKTSEVQYLHKRNDSGLHGINKDKERITMFSKEMSDDMEKQFDQNLLYSQDRSSKFKMS